VAPPSMWMSRYGSIAMGIGMMLGGVRCATGMQLVKGLRRARVKKKICYQLGGAPHRKGTCMRVWKAQPKKPNSAQRPLVRVFLSNRQLVTCHVPGETHNLQKFSTVLVRAGRIKDVPGCKFKLIRGKYDLAGLSLKRHTSRSKYGAKDFRKIRS